MKKLIIPINLLFFTVNTVKAQSQTENYLQSRTYLEPITVTSPDAKQINTIQYFDGLGRPKQIVNVKVTPLGQDLVTTIPYDGFGRQVDSWLPTPMNTLNGGIQSGVSGASQSYYNNVRAFTHQNLENSPLDRVLSQIQPGTEWQGHPVEFEYKANSNSEIRKYVTITSIVDNSTHSTLNVSSDVNSSNGFYKESQLYKNSVKDEDGNETIEFKNGQEQTLLIRKVIAANKYADTYYVYNEYNKLAFVIPPKASDLIKTLAPNVAISDILLNELCYQYRYDGKNRLVEKKVPGKGWDYMVYDKADRLILTQDSVMRLDNNWFLTKYDNFGRVIFTAIIKGLNRTEWDNILKYLVIAESRSSTGYAKNGMDIYYTNNYFAPDVQSVLAVNYYDTYPAGSPAIPTQILGQDVLPQDTSNSSVSTKSLPTASYVKNIEDDNWTKNYSYYDTRGRTAGSYSINHLGGFTETKSELDFAGVPKRINTLHVRRIGEPGVLVNERFIYDNQNRVLQHYHQVDSKPEELLAENSYTELSQLKNKKVGNNLQSIDYNYNIRGWMTEINKDQMPLLDLGGKLFSYKIKYNLVEGMENPDPIQFSGKDVMAKYNGNIAEVDWRSIQSNGANPPLAPKRYGYAYDKLNRLTAGYYQNPSNPGSKENTESIDYDLNGNIKNLYRTSIVESGTTATKIDDLEYIYDSGNQVSKINDHSQNPSGYEGGGLPITYDLNGNMKSMQDKNIKTITYNFLNIPNKIEYEGGVIGINYLYNTGGIKLQKKVPRIECGIINCTSFTDITDYIDGFQYLASINSGNGGGGAEEQRSFTVQSERAMEIQAFSIDERKVLPPPAAKNPDLQFFPTAEGFYDYKADLYIYQYKDHLGNVRLSFARTTSNTPIIIDNNDYYPFGMNHLKSGNAMFGASSYKNYKYNGKELQETGMYDYGARFYMPDIARWGVVDPLAEKYRRWSPYNYVMNNPIMFVDPDGRDIIIVITDDMGKKHYIDYVSGSKYVGSNTFVQKFYAAAETLRAKGAPDFISELESSKEKVYVQHTDGASLFTPWDQTIRWNENKGILTDNGISLTPTAVLNHEVDHGNNYVKDKKEHIKNTKKDKDNKYDNKEEERSITKGEQETAEKLGLVKKGQKTRTNHNGTDYDASHVNEQYIEKKKEDASKKKNGSN